MKLKGNYGEDDNRRNNGKNGKYCDYGDEDEYEEAELAQFDDRPDLRALNMTQAMEFGFA